MNKIYKVIWSKVKNQYVVVSELAHSSGKQSRTSRNSIRSRIAALVVCGAIAAFGVLPMNSASAALNVKAGDGIEVDQGWNTTISIKLVKDENEKLESGLTFDTNGGLKVDTGSGLIIKDNKVVIDLASGKGLTFDGNSLALDVKTGSGLTTDAQNGLKVKTGAGLKIDEQGQVALNVNTNNNSGLTFDEKNNELKVNTGSALEVNNNQVNVKLAKENSGLDATNGLAVKLAETDSGLTATSDGLKVNVKDDSGLKFENGALSIDKDALNMGSTNVKGSTNIDVAGDGTVSLKPDITLDTDTKNDNKIDLSGTNGTISAVNSKSSVDGPSGEWYENKTTTTNKITNTFDFSDGGKFVTEKNENTVVKNLKGKITSERDLVTTNTTEFNEKGATFSKVETDKGWKKKFLFGKDTWDTTTNSSTNIDGGKITLSSDARKDDKNVVIDGTAGEMTGLSNTKWDARKAANGSYESSNKAATEAQLQGVYNTAEDAYDTAKDAYDEAGKHTTVKLSDKNLTLKKGTNEVGGAEYTLGLNSVVTLNGDKPDGDGIVLNGESGSIHAVNTQAIGDGFFGNKIDLNKFDFDNDGAKFVTVKTKFGTAVKDGIEVHTTEFNENGATFTKTSITEDNMKLNNSSTNIDGGVVTTDIVKGLNNTEWNKGIAKAVEEKDELKGVAATQGQLKDVYTEATKHTTVELADNNRNLTLVEDKNEAGGTEYTLGLKNDLNVTSVTAGSTKLDSNGLTITGTNGNTTLANDGLTIGTTTYVSSTGLNAGNKVISNVANGEADADAVNVSQLNSKTGNLDYSSNKYVADNDNLTTAVGKLDDAIQKTSETANKGWTANAGNKDINVKSGDTLQFKGDNNITVSATTDIFGNNAINVGLEPVVTLDGNKLDGDSIVLNGNDGTINAVNSNVDIKTDYEWKLGHIIPSKVTTTTTSNKFNFDENGGKFVTTEDQIKVSTDISDNSITKVTHTAEFNENGATFTKTEGIILKNSSTTNIDGGTITTDKVQGLDNTTWDKGIAEKVANNKELQGMAATQGQLQTVDSKVNAGWIATDGTNKVNVNPNNNTLKFAGDDNITVTATTDKDGNNAINVKLDDDITLGNGENAINIDGKNGTLSIGNKFAVDEAGNVSSAGDVTAAGGKYSLSEVSQYAVRYDDNNGVVNTGKITLAGPNGTTIANVADAKNPDEAVNLHQLEAVKETASAGWTAKTGDDTITVKPNQILNFEGDGNITVSATSGTSSELKFGLNDNITLGDKAGQKTSTSLTLYTDPSPIKDKDGNYVLNKEEKTVTGYVPESYINDQGRVDDFVSTHGGFMMYATDTSGQGVFGITTDGMVHAKDVISYMPNSDPNSKDKILKYSLNDIGDIVTQIAHGQYDKTGMEYTLISDFSSVEDKDKPFQAEDGNRTIGLAVRQDGAVVVGAIVDEEGKLAESGIRINDDTNAGGGKDTITGLSNTTWTPPTNNSMARTNGDTRIDSMAATLGQLDDLYDSVVGYNVDENGSVNPNHVTLKGEEKYTFTTDANDVKTYSGGVKLDNVAYAVTDTNADNYVGSAAVNVDLLKDTVADVTSQASNSDRYLTGGNLDGNTLNLTVSDLNGYNNVITIGDIASKSEFDKQIGEINKQIGEINKQIDNIGTGTGGNNNTNITGGRVDKETGNLVLETDDGEISVGQLTDSAVSDVTFDKEKGTLTITNKDNYTGKESGTPITVDGIASKDDIKTVNDTIGVTSKEDLKEKYKDADTAYITDSETMVDADIALDHAVQDLASNDQYLNSRIDSVEKRLGDVEQRIDKVGAMAAAIANLRTMGFDPEAPTEIAVGVGQYKSETGLAIGVFHYPNQDFMLSASLSTSGDEVMGGIGATWRIGRKTAAEKAKDEEKRILAKAEEIKQAAKRAEVKAQADRHAKLLAEREAKGESIRPIENKVEQTQEQA